MSELILASSSEFRKQALANLGLVFKVVPADIDEKNYYDIPAPKRAMMLAMEKVKYISVKYPNAVIIGADTFGVDNNKYLEKAESKNEVVKILKKISGKKISFVTGVAVYSPKTKNIITFSDESYLQMRKLSDEKIDRYANSNDWIGMAGGFTIKSKGIALVESFEGSLNTILGLPTEKLVPYLEQEGIHII